MRLSERESPNSGNIRACVNNDFILTDVNRYFTLLCRTRYFLTHAFIIKVTKLMNYPIYYYLLLIKYSVNIIKMFARVILNYFYFLLRDEKVNKTDNNNAFL